MQLAHQVGQRPSPVVKGQGLQGQHQAAVHGIRHAEVADEDAVDVVAQPAVDDGGHGEDVAH